MNQIARFPACKIGSNAFPHDCPSACALEVDLIDARGQVLQHTKPCGGVRRGLLIAESIWPNAS